jgi:hypothetical protein
MAQELRGQAKVARIRLCPAVGSKVEAGIPRGIRSTVDKTKGDGINATITVRSKAFGGGVLTLYIVSDLAGHSRRI